MTRLFTNRDLVIISSIEWDFLWQGPQEIATRLAREGNRVLYIENTGIRAPKLRDARRVASRATHWAAHLSSLGLRTVADNLHVCSPIVLPPSGSNWQRKLNRKFFLPLIKRAVSNLRMRDPLLLSFLPTDTAVDLIQLLKSQKGLVIYYCVADFAELSSHPARLAETERQLLESSDLVFAQCDTLAKHCARWAADIHTIPYGVNLDVFAPRNGSANSHLPAIERSGEKRQPVIGYIGGLHRHVDLSLLTAMAEARPHWSWVCIGPAQTSLGKLAALPNVKLHGEFQHAELAQHVESFDVGIVPYVRSVFTDSVVPTKVNEYLAMGKAVVSTALPAVCGHSGWHGNVLTAEANPQRFIAAIEHALALPTDAQAKAQRRRVAALSDWQARLEHICDLIDKAAATKA